jgi:hypothetical protein
MSFSIDGGSLTKHLIRQKPEGVILFKRFADDILLKTTSNDKSQIQRMVQSKLKKMTNVEIEVSFFKLGRRQKENN